ncbi:ATP-binding protein [Candidatus Woesearchaeota archaeon]|nr:ATP-binding protein [Candidatus Woesearchaeota archaeon]
MGNIQFIDRKRELELLESLGSKDFFMVIRGRRRIGKTTLVRKAFPDAAYMFVWPNKSYAWVVDEICTEHSLPKFSNIVDVMRYLLDRGDIVIIDEFQNFLSIDKSVFGEMQKLIDERKMKKQAVRIIASGSSYSLINRLFNTEASPLYGRRTHEMVLQELPAEDLLLSLNTGMEEFVKVWSVFGGVPYYYAITELHAPIEKIIAGMIEKRDSMLLDEGKVILSVEFGRESKTYSTILTAIAEGKTRLGEISSLFSGKKGETMKYMDILRKEFGLIRRVTPILSDPGKSREGVYEINDNFLSFWFYFIDKQRAYIEQERFGEVISFFKENFPAYVGRKFEKFVAYLIRNKIVFSDFGFEKAGRQWGRLPDSFKPESGSDQYEIDLLALNEKTKEILFCECKWQDKVNAKKVAMELEVKSKFVNWNVGSRKEMFAIFAKSFGTKISEFEGKHVRCFDLKDLEGIVQNSK